MAPEHPAGFFNGRRGLRHPAGRMSPAAAVALFLTTAVMWLLTTRPAQTFSLGRLGSGAQWSVEQWTVLFSTVLGGAVLSAGLFAIAVYAVHWPAIKAREVRQQLVIARAEVAELRAEKDRLTRRVEALQRLRNEIAMLETQLLRVRQDSVHLQEAGRAVADGLEVVDDIIAELQGSGAWSSADR
ncbi:MAG TPA: hypothetical protein VLK84_32335 [Longimicrobium sp.]|nr:hypothetical protein [Longimicrobium sp.]